ncbi:hypothetical protein FB639_005585, partial [Coemansia asiatica]
TQCVAQTSPHDIAPDNCFRSVHWSPDGQSLATSSEDNALRIYDYNQCANEPQKLEPRLAISHGETLTAYAWYPFMNSADPATCCIAENTRDQPIHLRDTNNGGVRARYTALSSHETILTAGSVAFSSDGANILAGYAGHLAQFDVHRPGLPVDLAPLSPSRRSKEGMKGIVSCIAPNTDGRTMACATFSGHMSVRLQKDIRNSEILWSFPEEYGGRRGIDHTKWSSDGGILWASTRGSERYLVAWDTRDMRGPLHAIARQSARPDRGSQQRMLFDFDQSGRYLVAGQSDGSVAVYDTWYLDCNKPAYFSAHGDMVAGVCAHPYYSLLATASGQRHFDQPGSESEEDGDSRAPDNSLKIWSVSASYTQVE